MLSPPSPVSYFYPSPAFHCVPFFHSRDLSLCLLSLWQEVIAGTWGSSRSCQPEINGWWLAFRTLVGSLSNEWWRALNMPQYVRYNLTPLIQQVSWVDLAGLSNTPALNSKAPVTIMALMLSTGALWLGIQLNPCRMLKPCAQQAKEWECLRIGTWGPATPIVGWPFPSAFSSLSNYVFTPHLWSPCTGLSAPPSPLHPVRTPPFGPIKRNGHVQGVMLSHKYSGSLCTSLSVGGRERFKVNGPI